MKSKGLMIFSKIERTVYFAALILFAADYPCHFVSEKSYEVIFVILLFYYILQQIFLETVLHSYDGAFHFKCNKKYFSSTEVYSNYELPKIKREGAVKVAVIYFIFLISLLVMHREHFITWHLFMLGAVAILLLNNIFIYVGCPFQKLFMSTVNCCAGCYINDWDYFIFSTGMMFAPVKRTFSRVFIIIVFIISLYLLVAWEIKIRKYPERFIPKYNKSITCANCRKKCTFRKQ